MMAAGLDQQISPKGLTNLVYNPDTGAGDSYLAITDDSSTKNNQSSILFSRSASQNATGYGKAGEIRFISNLAGTYYDAANITTQTYQHNNAYGAGTLILSSGGTYAGERGYLRLNDAIDVSPFIRGDSILYGANSVVLTSGTDVRIKLNDGGFNYGTFRISNNTTEIATIHDTGITSIGDITAWGTLSDIKLKENVVRIPNGLEMVESLNGYTFNYIGKTNKMIGVIAQELEKVAPELVYETESLETGETSKAVRYSQITAILIEAVKELSEEIKELKKKLP
jgi:hypothetical protein